MDLIIEGASNFSSEEAKFGLLNYIRRSQKRSRTVAQNELLDQLMGNSAASYGSEATSSYVPETQETAPFYAQEAIKNKTPISSTGSVNQGAAVTLPASDDMVERLSKKVQDPYMAEKLFPKLAGQLAGQSLAPLEVARVILQVTDDYSQGFPSVIAQQTKMMAPYFIEALFDDSSQRRAVQDAWQGIVH